MGYFGLAVGFVWDIDFGIIFRKVKTIAIF